MLRRTVIAMLVFTSGCSLVFMQKPEPSYAAETQPQCSESIGWPVVDIVFALLGAATAITVASDPPEDGTGGIQVIGGTLDALIHGASALAGVGWASSCSDAKTEWARVDRIGPNEEARRVALGKQLAPRPVVAPAPPVPPAAQPRGFFCSSSAGGGGFCVRDKQECVRTRDVSIGALPDLSECALTEQAWCTGDLCFPSEEACDARRGRTGIELACGRMQ